MIKVKSVKLAILVSIIILVTSANAQQVLFANAQQLMVVIAHDWSSPQGHIYIFNKKHGKWKAQFNNAVVIGAKGLGVGEGAAPLFIADAPVKKEGDLKAPAGFFTMGTAFGYADKTDASWIKNRYLKASDTIICVDDQHSANYNRLVARDTTKNDYNSFEHMHRKDDLYKWGLFINHNAQPATAGNGSCIFMHIWRSKETGTEGCTAMQEKDLLKVLHWIDATKHPLLVQLPLTEYEKIRIQYGLPQVRL